MEKNDIWVICKINKKPDNQRLLGTNWVFSFKKNKVFKARLVAQGFTQVPGIDHQDNIPHVIYETIFRVVFNMWVIYGWSGNIIDI